MIARSFWRSFLNLDSLFFFETENEHNHTTTEKKHLTTRSAPTTSEVDGNLPSAPCLPRRSTNDIANASQQESAVHHLLNQARLATVSDFAGLRFPQTIVPQSHTPISLARPCSPVSSGYLSSFRRLWWRTAFLDHRLP